MKRILIIAGAVLFGVLAISWVWQQDEPWKVPEKYEKLKNPVVADDASIGSGKEFYQVYCRSCHGKDGKGTGNRAENLDCPPADFTSAVFQQQTDGALLYKIYFGHDEMPGFKTRLPGNEDAREGTFGRTRICGDLVNYLRSFAKQKAI